MNLSESYFMAVVEEKGISRAAEKLYLSQQNLSNHIKKLEEKYGLLFTRKPRFQLTEAGIALYETLQKMRILEQGLQTRLEEIRRDEIGTLRIGIHHTRAHAIMPDLMARFHARYGNIRLEVYLGETILMEKMLLNGEIDLFFGVDINSRPEFNVYPLTRELAYLVVSEALLKAAGLNPPAVFPKKDLEKLPFMMRSETSRFQQKVNEFTRKNHLELKTNLLVDDFALQETFAAEQIGAYFMPEMFLANVEKHNQQLRAGEKLRVFRVEDFDAESYFSLVTHRDGYLFPAMRYLMESAGEVLRKNQENHGF